MTLILEARPFSVLLRTLLFRDLLTERDLHMCLFYAYGGNQGGWDLCPGV